MLQSSVVLVFLDVPILGEVFIETRFAVHSHSETLQLRRGVTLKRESKSPRKYSTVRRKSD